MNSETPTTLHGRRTGEAWEALRDGRWEQAKDHFTADLARAETPEALEGLGRATRWLNEFPECFEAQERAYLLYKDRGDERAAAAVAIDLARDTVLTRDDVAVARGWFARAERLLADQPECAVHAWLDFRRGQVALYNFNDLDEAGRLLDSAVLIGRRHDDFDVEMAALSQLGLIKVTSGELDAGMKALDEAAAAAVNGEIALLDVAGGICCDVIFACERVRDIDRASQWCDAATAIAEHGHLSPLMGACRAHYASILMWQGEWNQAEQHLVTAGELMNENARGISREAVERLAHLRCMQGRYDEAWELCEQIEWAPGAKACMARIAFERGDFSLAQEMLERHLRGLPASERLGRVVALELGVELGIARGDVTAAEAAATELRELADDIGTDSLNASAGLARARLLAAADEGEAALAPFEQAIDLWSRNRALYEAAIARAELAAVLERLGRDAAAAAARQRANDAFQEMGAARRASQAGDSPGDSPRADGALTPRETEVLRLVAEGLSNEQVAERLVVSPHTVHRHMANIRSKLDQPSRAAAVAYATREGLI